MRRCAAWFLAAGLILGWSNLASPQTSSIEQHSEGACSPPIVNNEGHVSISCQGIDETALRYLENKLSERLSEQLRGLDDSGRTIRNLNDLNENLRQQAD